MKALHDTGIAKLLRWAHGRITVGSAFAAVPPLLTATVFLLVCGFDVTFGGHVTRKHMVRAMELEMMLIHAFAFLGLAILADVETWWQHVLRALFFAGMCTLYCAGAYEMGGWAGVATLWGLGLATYTGMLFRRDIRRMTQLGIRWLFGTVTLVFGVYTPLGIYYNFKLDRTPDHSDVPIAGFFYFALLGIYELLRVYDRWSKEVERASAKG